MNPHWCMGFLNRQYLKLGLKCVEVVTESDALRLVGNGFIEFRQRIITAASVKNHSVHTIRSGKKKVLYLYFEGFGVECVEGVRVLDDVSTHLAHLKHTLTKIGGFITIITSGQFLVDYAVLSDDVAAVVIPGKREVYIDKHHGEVTIYIV